MLSAKFGDSREAKIRRRLFERLSKSPHIFAMGVRKFLVRLLHRSAGGGRVISGQADESNEAAVSMHKQAAKEYGQAAKEHKQAAKLHESGAHNAAAEKGSEAETAGHRATQAARDASSAETDARQQKDLDSGRLYLGD
jgi:cell wall-associated NlpC family hydrolase